MDEAWPTALLELRPPYVWLKEEGGGGAMQGRAGLGEHRDREWDRVCIGGVARHDKENREHEWCMRIRKVVHHHMPI